ncbi:MAG: acyltransferase [Candidatus Thiodiazotropha sp.]
MDVLSMGKTRLLELDVIRGIASLSVVIYHYLYRYNVLYGHDNYLAQWAQYVQWGKYGVQLFFIVSGFVIFLTLNKMTKSTDFIVSRFSRLYPVYWASLISTFLIVSIFGLDGREVGFSEFIVNFTMLQEFINVESVDRVYWTLSIELTFYFLMFLLFFFRQLQNVENWLLVIVCLAILYGSQIIFIPDIIKKIFILKFIGFFASGICFYKIWASQSSVKTYLLLSLAFIANICVYGENMILTLVLIYLVFSIAISGYFKIFTTRPLLFLGSISYSLYLVHQNIGYVAINYFYSLSMDPLICIVLAISITILISTVLTLLIEKPSIKYIRGMYNGYLNRRYAT